MIQHSHATNELFEGVDLTNVSAKEIQTSKKLFNYIVESAAIATEEGKSLDDVMDEGLFTALLGGVAGSTIGPAIMKAICKVLGIDEKGALGSLMTSKVILSAMGSQLGYRM